MRENSECFFEFAKQLSKQHEKQLRNNELSEKDLNFFQEHVRQSVEKQGQYEQDCENPEGPKTPSICFEVS